MKILSIALDGRWSRYLGNEVACEGRSEFGWEGLLCRTPQDDD